MNQSALDRITALESAVSTLSGTIQDILASKATDTSYGLAKVSEATKVTEANNGLVLSAKEKNPAVDGTIANEISHIKSELSTRKNVKYNFTVAFLEHVNLFSTSVPAPIENYNVSISLIEGIGFHFFQGEEINKFVVAKRRGSFYLQVYDDEIKTLVKNKVVDISYIFT